ncbi:hypothetical protein SUGI_0996820 [Cryptomeria japonica]|nr:hypothetical protein SUGI_0996820 [Cryptomeria japonica]
MEPPFMKGYWNSPENMLPRGTRRSWHEKGSPRPRSSRAPAIDRRDNPSKSRINIPVEYVDSSSASKPHFQTKKKKNYRWRAKMSKPTAAVKMQAAYRGFRVRKSMPLKNLKAIAQAKKSMEELKRQLGYEKVVQLIRQNEKERLRIAEGLMSLLLKLDAIQGVDTIVRESRKAVIRELIKLQVTVDAIIVEKTLESEPPTKKAEESVLSNKESSPEVQRVLIDIQASESNAASSSNTDLTSLETELAKKVILSEKDPENNKDFSVVKKMEPSQQMKNPKEKEKMASLNETMDSSGTANGSSKPLKDSSGTLEDSSLEPVEDSSEAETFSSGGDVNDNDDVSIVDQEQISSDMPQLETSESGAMEEDFGSASRNAILQEAFEMLDQIKSQISEGQAQKYNEAPLQANDAANIVQKNEEKLKKVISEHSIQSTESSEGLHKGEDTSNQGKSSQQDEISEAKISVQANNSEEAACVKKRGGTNKDMKSFSQRQKDDDNESKGQSTIIAVENALEENKKLNKVIEDLHQRNQMQSEIIGHIYRS